MTKVYNVIIYGIADQLKSKLTEVNTEEAWKIAENN